MSTPLSRERTVLAIVGRPNVGKSTLFNRIVGERVAIVSDVPGTTRDRVAFAAVWNNKRFTVIDTGGLFADDTSDLSAAVQAQTTRAIATVSALILVVDVIDGVTYADQAAAKLVRDSGKPAVLAVNKVDNSARELAIGEFYSLGIETVIPISAHHGLGNEDILQEVFTRLDITQVDATDEHGIKTSIIGHPNTGKSSLFNALTQDDNSVVSPIPGTTRDTVNAEFNYHGERVVFLDTAGLRRRGRIDAGIEKYSTLRSLAAMARADVALLVVAADEVMTQQDLHIAGYAQDAWCSCVIVVNKIDLLPDEDDRLALHRAAANAFRFVPGASIVMTSALTGEGVHKVMPTVLRAYREFTRELEATDLSRCVFSAVGKLPPSGKGWRVPRIVAVKQQGTAPPTIVFKTRHHSAIHFSYKRYLENKIREEFGLHGSPLVMVFKGGG